MSDVSSGPKDVLRRVAAETTARGVLRNVAERLLRLGHYQSWRVKENNGNCRVVLAWASPRDGYCATSFGHS
jgi:hypothetical protein